MFFDANSFFCVDSAQTFFLKRLSLTVCLRGGHPVFPAVESSMEQPKEFTTVLSVSFLILTAMYIPVAAGGYHMLAYGLFPGRLELD